MKVAIIHDSLSYFGGAERTLLSLADAFPQADIITSLFNKNIKEFRWLQDRIKKKFSIYHSLLTERIVFKPVFQLYWETINLTKYHIVLTSSDALSSKSIVTSPNTLHICYCHTPPKYLYPEKPRYEENKSIFPIARHFFISYLRSLDFISAQRPDILIANSKTVRERIKKYYRRNAQVIYPPVSVPSNAPSKKYSSDYYVSAGHSSRAKGTDLIIKAFNNTQKKLMILGSGKLFSKHQKLAGKNVHLLGHVDERTKWKYLKKAKAFISAAVDEDFGIAAVEAMAHGVPVIAYRSGGLTETVIEEKTGLFFDEHTPKALNETIDRFERIKLDPLTCFNHAKQFSQERFLREIKLMVNNAYEEKIK